MGAFLLSKISNEQRLAAILMVITTFMNYNLTLIWTSMRPHISFDPIAVECSPVKRYEEIRRRHLLEHGILLPVPKATEWSCGVLYENELSLSVTIYSELKAKAIEKQLERALVPEFTDRVEVRLSTSRALGVVCSN